MDDRNTAWRDSPPQFYREERARKLGQIEFLTSSKSGTALGQGGNLTDDPSNTIEQLKAEIAELERLLSAAGEPFDA